MKISGFNHFCHISCILIVFSLCQCSRTEPDPDPQEQDPYNPQISDDYSYIADKSYSNQWGSYNLHDPAIIRHNEYYYIFSTDVAYGPNGRCGIMYRKSSDLVHWTFLGWVFDGVPPKPLAFMEANQPGYEQLSLWAPFIIKAGETYRLYYSVPGNDGLKLACIALATAASPEGPWNDEGIVISCLPSDNFNAIDPSVIVDRESGEHWMCFGSYSAGIFIVELDQATGLLKNPGDKGKLLAFRSGFMDAIEGGELFYYPGTGKYYLFVSYDWLEDNYNVRVGRSDTPEGPYYDLNGHDMAAAGDNFPMITARYRFNSHSGWQGFGHCSILSDEGKYFYISQARLGSNKYLMDLHIHRMVWSKTGWPSISPERYVNVPQTTITAADIKGKWEHIDLISTTTFNVPSTVELGENGTVKGIANSSWSFIDGILTLNLRNSADIYSCTLLNEWDWEYRRRTIVYTGITPAGKSGWGKKID